MDIDLVFKIAAIGIVVAVLNQLLVLLLRFRNLLQMNMWRPAGIAGKFINLSAMLDNTVIIIMFIIMMDLGKKNISQKKAHGEAGALKLNFLDIILVTRLMKRNLIVDLSVVL